MFGLFVRLGGIWSFACAAWLLRRARWAHCQFDRRTGLILALSEKGFSRSRVTRKHHDRCSRQNHRFHFSTPSVAAKIPERSRSELQQSVTPKSSISLIRGTCALVRTSEMDVRIAAYRNRAIVVPASIKRAPQHLKVFHNRAERERRQVGQSADDDNDAEQEADKERPVGR